MEPKNTDRRKAILSGLATGAGAALALSSAPSLAQRGREACPSRTAPQPEGPFYPIRQGADVDADMTRLQGSTQAARGEIVDLAIRVVDPSCRPIAGATVDMWQACATGRYNHPSDGNSSAALDPDFQYQAILTTKEDGSVSVRTIKPGAYPNDPSWVRPPHIHFRISAPGYRDLTTQMYFAGEALNEIDLILKRLSPADRANLVVRFLKPTRTAAIDRDVPAGIFTVTLEKA